MRVEQVGRLQFNLEWRRLMFGCGNLGDCPIGVAQAIVGAGNSHGGGRVSPRDDVGKTQLGGNSRTDSRQGRECRRTA